MFDGGDCTGDNPPGEVTPRVTTLRPGLMLAGVYQSGSRCRYAAPSQVIRKESPNYSIILLNQAVAYTIESFNA